MERTYFDLRITFIHILIFFLALGILGIMVFYMGYRVGSRSNPPVISNNSSETISSNRPNEEWAPVKEKKAELPRKIPDSTRVSVPSERDVHQESEKKATAPPSQTKEALKIIYTIRVGSFANPENAAHYAEKFQQKGYPVAVISPKPGDKGNLYQVRVGVFTDKEKAKIEKEKLEKLEKKKFLLIVQD